MGKRRLAVRIIRAQYHVVPNHVVGADGVAQANADGVLLEAQDDVAAEKSLGKMAYLTLLLLARISSVKHWHKWEEEP